MGGTATVSEDYADFLDADIAVAPGKLTKDFDITIIDDGAAESGETITIKWTKISTDPGTPGVLNFTGTITDNDGGTNTCVLGGDVWCATLTVQNLGGARGHGCANSQSGKACSNPSHLTEDEFLHDGTDYDVTSISVTPNDELKLWLAPDPTAPTRTLVLVVDGERFALAHSGGETSGSRTGRSWDSSGLSWSTGDTVELRLVEGFPPDAPSAPGVNGIAGSDRSLKVTWGVPGNAGPPITHYDLRYRETTGPGSWQSGPQDQPATNARNATIGSLTTDAEYDVQVRASNADGDGPWSPSGQGTPGVVETEETIPNGSLRLVVDDEGTISTTGGGRLEVYFNRQGMGEWGTVCDDRFDREFLDYSIDTEIAPGDPNAPKADNIAATLACRWSGAGTEGAMVTADSLGMTTLPDVPKGHDQYRPKCMHSAFLRLGSIIVYCYT